ncbi:MAG: hypothetical protein JWN99_2037, partial [Ilumatobacteraceae bacterium]|nr:hypothetical protein [Ilumatobacteraceae bacterium]
MDETIRKVEPRHHPTGRVWAERLTSMTLSLKQ